MIRCFTEAHGDPGDRLSYLSPGTFVDRPEPWWTAEKIRRSISLEEAGRIIAENLPKKRRAAA